MKDETRAGSSNIHSKPMTNVDEVKETRQRFDDFKINLAELPSSRIKLPASEKLESISSHHKTESASVSSTD